MFKLSVLHLLDGIGQIQGALASTTTHELSNTPFTSNTRHGEGIQQIVNFYEAEYETTLERYVTVSNGHEENRTFGGWGIFLRFPASSEALGVFS
jgi:hypothetical protein